MTTTTGPVDLVALTAWLHTNKGPGVLRCSGDPTTAGAELSSSQWTDADITAAISACPYVAPVDYRAQLAALAVAAKAGTLTAAEIQQAIAALIAIT